MIEAVAIRDVDLSYPALEPIECGGQNLHEPEMRDVHRGLNALQADVVQETFHVVQRLDEGELERKQFDRKLEAPFRCVSSNLLRSIDHELPLALRQQQAVLEHVLSRDEAEVDENSDAKSRTFFARSM